MTQEVVLVARVPHSRHMPDFAWITTQIDQLAAAGDLLPIDEPGLPAAVRIAESMAPCHGRPATLYLDVDERRLVELIGEQDWNTGALS